MFSAIGRTKRGIIGLACLWKGRRSVTPIVDLIYDTFTRADSASPGSTETVGPLGENIAAYPWTGGSIVGGRMVLTPGLGSELIVDGGLENWDSPTDLTSWTEGAGVGNSINQESSVVHSGSYAARVDIGPANNTSYLIQDTTVARYSWMLFSVWAKSSTGTGTFIIYRNGVTSGSVTKSLTAIYTQYVFSSRSSSSSPAATFAASISAANRSLFYDDFSLKVIATPTLFSSVTAAIASATTAAGITLVPGNPAGLVINLDSTNAPENFVIAYHDGSVAKLEKCVAGTYTTLINVVVAYIPGAIIQVIKDGTKYKMYYNNVLIGAEQTISDSGIINNVKYGLFSTYSGNVFDNFKVDFR